MRYIKAHYVLSLMPSVSHCHVLILNSEIFYLTSQCKNKGSDLEVFCQTSV